MNAIEEEHQECETSKYVWNGGKLEISSVCLSTFIGGSYFFLPVRVEPELTTGKKRELEQI